MNEDQEEKRKYKKKFWIILSSVAIALVIGLSVTVGVLAATSISATNTIGVTYTSTQVAATISGTYQVKNSESATSFVKTGTGTGEENPAVYNLVFDGSEATASGSFITVNDIVLTATNNYVTFSYTIVNSTDSSIDVALTLPSTQTNVTITETDGSSNAISSHTLVIAQSATGVYNIKVEVTNLAQSAAFSGTFTFALTRHSA